MLPALRTSVAFNRYLEIWEHRGSCSTYRTRCI